MMKLRNLLMAAGAVLSAVVVMNLQSEAAKIAVQAVAGTMAKKPEVSIGQAGPMLVTFIELGSVRCIPCKMMQPVMAEVEKEYGTQVKVVFHDVWTQAGRPFAEQFGIRGIPTQVFLDKDGHEYFRHMGFFPKLEIVKVLKKQGVK